MLSRENITTARREWAKVVKFTYVVIFHFDRRSGLLDIPVGQKLAVQPFTAESVRGVLARGGGTSDVIQLAISR